MTDDIFEGKWKQPRGRHKKTWGVLTDDELDQIEGKRDRLSGKIQERYDIPRRKRKVRSNASSKISREMFILYQEEE